MCGSGELLCKWRALFRGPFLLARRSGFCARTFGWLGMNMKWDRNNDATERYLHWVLLALVLLAAAALRYGLMDQPLERDEGEYALAGQLLLDGTPPYVDVYNMKLPGIYGMYAAILAAFGQTPQGIHIGLLLANLATIVAVFLLGRHLMGVGGALIAAASFAILSTGQPVLGMHGHAEHFVILFSIPGLLMLLRDAGGQERRRLIVAGVLLGTGVMMKQHGSAFLILAAVMVPLSEGTSGFRSAGKRLAFLAAGAAGVYAVVALAMAWAGVFDRFWYWTVEYARTYVSAVPMREAWPVLAENTVAIVRSAPLLWISAAIGIVGLAGRTVASLAHRRFLVLLAGASILSIVPGFYFRPHYFILLLPAASLLMGWAYVRISDLPYHGRSFVRQGAVLAFFLLAFAQALWTQQDYLFRMNSFQASRSSFSVNPFPESFEIANFLRQRTTEEDRIAILGSEPQILFYAHRRPVNGHVYMYPLMDAGDHARRMQHELIGDIEQKRPRYVLYVNVPMSWLRFSGSPRDLFLWFDQYQKEHLKLVGVIELYPDGTVAHWERQAVWPVASPYWIAVFEHRTTAVTSSGGG